MWYFVNHSMKEMISAMLYDIGNQFRIIEFSYNWSLNHCINLETMEDPNETYPTYTLLI